MSDIKRIWWLKLALGSSFILGIILANHLWIADRLYPLTPAFKFLSFIPSWMDYLLSSLLIVFLGIAAFSSKPKKYIIAALILVAFLFLEDQSRLWPSFYEYAFLLFILAFYDDAKTSRCALNACRLIIICVYVWTGAQKITPFFEEQLFSLFAPILHFAPSLGEALIHWGSIIVPLVEIEIGIALLFKKTRMLALIEALIMHGMLFFLLGPFRDPWNAGAWAWNLASAFLVFILFFRTDDFSAKEILSNKRFPVHQIVLVLLGILPLLSFMNMWGSALSFNVYSGNIAQGRVHVSSSLGERLPKSLQPYLLPNNEQKEGDLKIFDINKWSESEFRAEPYPEPRVLKNVAATLCNYAFAPSDVILEVRDKLTLQEQWNWFGNIKRRAYDCSELSPESRFKKP